MTIDFRYIGSLKKPLDLVPKKKIVDLRYMYIRFDNSTKTPTKVKPMCQFVLSCLFPPQQTLTSKKRILKINRGYIVWVPYILTRDTKSHKRTD